VVATTYDDFMVRRLGCNDWLMLTADPLDEAAARAWVAGPEFGAVVCFSGLVRSSAQGRHDVSAIEYEAYEEQVVAGFAQMCSRAREADEELGRIVLWHRVGLVALGEASVVVAVSAPHRDSAFRACRRLIDSVKESSPIWKRELWPGGGDWSPAAVPIVDMNQGEAQ
jgi:molybdopterin synthase catalytic subunit